ncbi:hypothetical protein [Salibacterium qingdaonense]|uniref:Uncharacterized protein n=1 Tax=Salibacterium qingdaonense TaxID=266892 RepID=A0A1I4PNM1_9BACI|nr:hypothetical protein [Salibacterium qingdaonense]SFM29053.1 hypothetical protein SAMN04488054_1298 [Salibacterium qingdaonense]
MSATAKKSFLILYWVILTCGAASYSLFYYPDIMIISITVLLFCSLSTMLIASALKNRRLLIQSIMLLISPLLVLGVCVLITALFNVEPPDMYK